MTQPILLDLFCGAGGASMGYYKAGFKIIGVDNKPQPRYPFEFIQGDAIEVGSRLLQDRDISVVAASPPCQEFSDLKNLTTNTYINMIPETRELLIKSGLPYVIENVDRAPLIDPVKLCGQMFPGLRVFRHRIFESNVKLTVPVHEKHRVKVFTYDKRKPQFGQALTPDMFVTVTGGGNAPLEVKLAAMGIDWTMRAREVNQAIPPAYTEYLGRQIYGLYR